MYKQRLETTAMDLGGPEASKQAKDIFASVVSSFLLDNGEGEEKKGTRRYLVLLDTSALSKLGWSLRFSSPFVS